MKLDANNVEELIFMDKGLCKKLPDFKISFDHWKLGSTTPGLRTLAKRAILEFLASLEDNHINIIENHLKMRINVDKNLDPRTVRDIKSTANSLNETLKRLNPKGNFSISRDGEQVYICFWK